MNVDLNVDLNIDLNIDLNVDLKIDLSVEGKRALARNTQKSVESPSALQMHSFMLDCTLSG